MSEKSPRPDVLEIAERDLGARDVLGPLGLDDLLGQVEEPAAVVLVLPEAPRREQEIEVGQVPEREGRPVEGEARLEKRHVEGLAVIGDDRLETHVLEELGDLADEPALLGHLAQKELGRP